MRLIYLDQSVLSSMFGAGNTPTREFQNLCHMLTLKLLLLKEQGHVKIVISNIHSRETAGIPDEHVEQREHTWKAMNQLADGVIANDWIDVFVAQQRRCLMHPEECGNFCLSDIGIPEQDNQGHSSVRVISTNEWRLRLYASEAREKNDRNAIIRNVIDRQVKSLGTDIKPEDVVAIVRNGWKNDIKNGIAAWRRGNDAMNRFLADPKLMLSTNPPDIPDIQDISIFSTFVKPIIKGPDEEDALKKLEEQVEKEQFCAALELRIALEAEMLLKRMRRKSDKKFNKEFGVSMQNDIDHVSSFAPYCDAVTTDRGMIKLCEGEIAKSVLENYHCTLFSNDNLGQLNEWIDSLLPESGGAVQGIDQT